MVWCRPCRASNVSWICICQVQPLHNLCVMNMFNGVVQPMHSLCVMNMFNGVVQPMHNLCVMNMFNGVSQPMHNLCVMNMFNDVMQPMHSLCAINLCHGQVHPMCHETVLIVRYRPSADTRISKICPNINHGPNKSGIQLIGWDPTLLSGDIHWDSNLRPPL